MLFLALMNAAICGVFVLGYVQDKNDLHFALAIATALFAVFLIIVYERIKKRETDKLYEWIDKLRNK